MTHVDMTELRELRERLKGVTEDNRLLGEQLAATQSMLRESDRKLEEVTYHRNRLLDEKRLILDVDFTALTVLPASADPEQLELPPLPSDGADVED